MAQTSPRPRRSVWTGAAAVLFVLAAIAFLWLWNVDNSSGIGRLIHHGAGVGSFLVLWAIGFVCLVTGGVLRFRRRQRPAVPLVPVGLGLASAFLLVWVAHLRITPERLLKGARTGDVGEVERCLRRGIDVDARCEELLGFGGKQESPTALGAAAASGRTDVVQLLLDAGADPAARDSHGYTPAEAAELSGFVELAKLLRAREAQGTTEPGAGTDGHR